MRQKTKKSGIIASLIVCLLLVSISLILIINKQYIIDQITFWQYKPTAEVASLADRAGMNDKGKFYFYASQPSLYLPKDAKIFNNYCDKFETTTAILGCYSGSKIYIYEVTDKKLDGISEVTATHETLHAIYARLDHEEKAKVNKLLDSEYTKLVNDKYYADLMLFYANTEPGQRDNELHSIIGTEVSTIDPELETYYNKYFANRQKVVALDVKYSSAFKTLKTQADDLSKQIDALLASIKSRTDQYNVDARTLSADIASFNSRANSGDFTSQWQYNNERSALNARVAQLDDERISIKSDISSYQFMIDEHNSIAIESSKLYNAINSTLVSSPSV